MAPLFFTRLVPSPVCESMTSQLSHLRQAVPLEASPLFASSPFRGLQLRHATVVSRRPSRGLPRPSSQSVRFPRLIISHWCYQHSQNNPQ
jgi:hypothetical protein